MKDHEPRRRGPRHASRHERGHDTGHRGSGVDDPVSTLHPSLLGTLPPRDAFFLNPYPGIRFSRCPRCGHRTWRRGMRAATPIDEVLRHTAPFATEVTVEYTPATWVAERPPGKGRSE